MQPIVNGLEEQYSTQMTFFSLNAQDAAEGQAAYEFYALRGHPTVVIVAPGGDVTYQQQGIIPQEALREAIEDAIGTQ